MATNADPSCRLGNNLGRDVLINLACHAIGLYENSSSEFLVFAGSMTALGTSPAILSNTTTPTPAFINPLAIPKASSPVVG